MSSPIFGNLLKERNKNSKIEAPKHLTLKQLMRNYEDFPNTDYILNFCFDSQVPPLTSSQNSQSGASCLNIHSSLIENELSIQNQFQQWSSISYDIQPDQQQNICGNEDSLTRQNDNTFTKKKQKNEKVDMKIQTKKLLQKIDHTQKKLDNKIADLMEKLKIEREKLGKNKKEEKENINGNADNGIRFSFAFSLQETQNILIEQKKVVMLKDIAEIESQPFESYKAQQSDIPELPLYTKIASQIVEPIKFVDSIFKME